MSVNKEGQNDPSAKNQPESWFLLKNIYNMTFAYIYMLFILFLILRRLILIYFIRYNYWVTFIWAHVDENTFLVSFRI